MGARIRLRRMLLGLSQERLADQLGLTFQQVQKYEKGINRIGAGRLWELATVLGVPVSYFFQEAPGQSSETAASMTLAEHCEEPYWAGPSPARDSVELAKAFALVSDTRTRRAIVELVRSLVPDGKNGDREPPDR